MCGRPMSLKPIIPKMVNLCKNGVMSTCGGYEKNNFEECEFHEESKYISTCLWNPFSEVCTCISAQLNRDGVAI